MGSRDQQGYDHESIKRRTGSCQSISSPSDASAENQARAVLLIVSCYGRPCPTPLRRAEPNASLCWASTGFFAGTRATPTLSTA
jgi:hypothetical protein